MKKYLPQTLLLALSVVVLSATLAAAAPILEVGASASNAPQTVTLAGDPSAAVIAVDEKDYPVVTLAAGLFADDIKRVTGKRPAITGKPTGAPQMVIVGTLGHSALIDRLAQNGKLRDIAKIKGGWETTLWQVVENPFPGVKRALVIAGSDRRGAAYGLTQLSEKIGVSPWYWWADVPVERRGTLTIKVPAPQMDAPSVKYRGIFINDEDWGINQWASKTFDPQFGNIGPKTYEKVFELMLRLRLNYLWPAMHGCSREFGSVPENYILADRYAIVMGASHCEPMLYNNVHWDAKAKGHWNYATNRDVIHGVWEDTAKARGSEEAVWTLGIRGIHDRGMESPPDDVPGRINVVSQAIKDQRDLLNQYVTKDWGPVAQCFVPYKEVLPLYDAGLKVPEDVTLVWADDNFGYMRRLSDPEERKRSGGAGVYWHLSYYGVPHSYTWINTTAPALMWEELGKAWENDARTLWVVNVGDLKPMEIGVDYLARLAWRPEAFGPDSQPLFLRDFAAKNFGPKFALPIADFLGDFYRLGTIRKPELMNRAWALSLPPDRAAELRRDYEDLLKQDTALAAVLPAGERDAYTELVGFPARVLGATGLIFLADRDIQQGVEAAAHEREIAHWRDFLTAEVENYNTKVAGGKWNHMMPGLVTGKDLTQWSSQVRWPWGEKPLAPGQPAPASTLPAWPPEGQSWRDAPSRQTAVGGARWVSVSGLGPTGRAMALTPANLTSSWSEDDKKAPTLEFDFTAKGGDAEAFVDFLPTFRLYPGMQLRVALSIDDSPPSLVEVPGSSGAENENGPVRRNAVQDNYARLRVPLQGLSAGPHVLKIRAVDPGVFIDRISLP